MRRKQRNIYFISPFIIPLPLLSLIESRVTDSDHRPCCTEKKTLLVLVCTAVQLRTLVRQQRITKYVSSSRDRLPRDYGYGVALGIARRAWCCDCLCLSCSCDNGRTFFWFVTTRCREHLRRNIYECIVPKLRVADAPSMEFCYCSCTVHHGKLDRNGFEGVMT